MTDSKFIEICQALGLCLLDSYFSKKLVFYALELRDDIDKEKLSGLSKKKLVNDGEKRNNFSILFDELGNF